MKVSELTEIDLDYWVAKAQNWKVQRFKDGLFELYSGSKYSPSTDWAQGGPIIERERVTVEPCIECPEQWAASVSDDAKQVWIWAHGPTPLVAAMRCLVTLKFGEEVG